MKSFSQSAGLYETYIVFGINGNANLYYDLNADTGNYDFDGQFLGTFCEGDTNGLIFKGGEHKIYKCGGCDLTSTRIYYRVYLTGSPSGSYVSNSLGYLSGFNNGCGGQNQIWDKVDYNTNVLDGLSSGDYTIEVYSDATVTCDGGTVFASNGGENYKATFTINASTVGGMISGDAAFCSGANSGALTLSGNTGDVVRWESSITSDFSASVVEIDNTTTSLNIENILTTTYYRAVVKNGECGEEYSGIHTLTINPNSWTGTVDTDWNEPLNWCGGVPVATDAVEIPLVTNQPIIASGDNILVESVNVFSGATLVVESGGNLTVANAVTVASGGDFTVNNNANLIQVNDVSNSGSVTVIKNSSALYRLDYTLWSSPVTGQNLQDFSPLTLSNRFYDYDESTDSYSVITPSTNDFSVGRACLIRAPNTYAAYVDDDTSGVIWEGTFVGEPNNGDVAVSTTTALNGYNLVGNPYPSSINVNDFFDANVATVNQTSALYFWRKRNDPNTTTYAMITKAAYVANAAAGGDTGASTFIGDSSDWVVNTGQGFFVQTTGASIVFNNSMRRGVNNQQFFRMEQQDEDISEVSRIWLNITGDEGEFKQMAIVYNNQTTLGLDYGWDGEALSDGPIALYSTIEGVNLGVQARSQFNEEDVVPIAYEVTNSGSYTISLDHFDGVFLQGQDVYLKDNVTGQLIDVKNTSYTFSTIAGLFTDRFEVVYSNQALSINDLVLDTDTVVVYQKNDVLTIDSSNLMVKEVTVYDVQGRVVYEKRNIDTDVVTITDLQLQKQMLLVEITVDDRKVYKKIML